MTIQKHKIKARKISRFFRDTSAPSFSLFLFFFFFLHKNRDSHNPGHNACRAAAVSTTEYKKYRGKRVRRRIRLTFSYTYIICRKIHRIKNKIKNFLKIKNIFKNIQTLANPLFMRVSGFFRRRRRPLRGLQMQKKEG